MADSENTRTVPAGTTAPAGADTNDITLNTDADFAAAETELLRLLAVGIPKGTPDGEWHVYQEAWWRLHEALITAEPRTAFQAAVILRRATCRDCGIPCGSNDITLPAIERVAEFLATPPADIGSITGRACQLADDLNDVKRGVTAIVDFAAASDDGDAPSIAWIARRLEENVAAAIETLDGIRTTLAAPAMATNLARLAETEATVARFKAAAEGLAPDHAIHVQTQDVIDGAVADAVFVLARALRWGQFEPMVAGLRRAGIVGGEA